MNPRKHDRTSAVNGRAGRVAALTVALALLPARAGAQIELPAIQVTRIQTTVWVPAGGQTVILGMLTTVEAGRPAQGWLRAPVGPRRWTPVYARSEIAPEAPRRTHGGLDAFVVEGLREPPPRAPVDPDEGLSALETARARLARGAHGPAAEAYAAHLRGSPRDARARRELGVCLCHDGKVVPGRAELLEAYAGDPALVETPVAVELLKGGAGTLARLADAALGRARAKPGAGTWLAALVFAQADGRWRALPKLTEAARRGGLDDDLCARFARWAAERAAAEAGGARGAGQPR